jgi:anti-anti-sigma regulatory factor
MSTPAANLLVLVGKHFACIKIVGRANFTMSIDFKTLLLGLQQKGFGYFVIELSECLLMDSTFLGVLAGFGLKMSQPEGDSQPCPVELRNPNARVSELIENVGVLHLFKVTQGPLSAPEALEACAPETAHPSREDITRACLEAHQTLMEINPENVTRFKEVARFLAEDLQKLTDRT